MLNLFKKKVSSGLLVTTTSTIISTASPGSSGGGGVGCCGSSALLFNTSSLHHNNKKVLLPTTILLNGTTVRYFKQRFDRGNNSSTREEKDFSQVSTTTNNNRKPFKPNFQNNQNKNSHQSSTNKTHNKPHKPQQQQQQNHIRQKDKYFNNNSTTNSSFIQKDHQHEQQSKRSKFNVAGEKNHHQRKGGFNNKDERVQTQQYKNRHNEGKKTKKHPSTDKHRTVSNVEEKKHLGVALNYEDLDMSIKNVDEPTQTHVNDVSPFFEGNSENSSDFTPFTKELEINVDILLKRVLEKVKTQNAAEPEKPSEETVFNPEDEDGLSSLLRSNDSSIKSEDDDLFKPNDFSVIGETEEAEEEDFIGKKFGLVDTRHRKPLELKKKHAVNDKEEFSEKVSATDLKDARFIPSIGIKYRPKGNDEPLPALHKYLVEFGDSEYLQLAETHPSDKMYVGDSDINQVPSLKNGLHKVLTSPGVHRMYDGKTKTHFFHPYMRQLHKPEEINFKNLTPFIPPSQDTTLHKLMDQYPCKYQSSTSSITSPLVSLYLALSNYKPTRSRNLENFKYLTSTFTPAVRKPVVFILRPKHSKLGHTFYSVDSYKFLFEPRSNQILMDLGKVMEKLFVMDPEEFEGRFVKRYAGEEQSCEDAEVYRYLRHGGFLLRSQLDCYHPQYGVFDIKTRATNPIRINMEKYQKFTNIKLKMIKGNYNSYEREFYDMVRSVFIKYSMQGRIGGMDGMFLAYHNTVELFGFEYIKLKEIDNYVFGSSHMAERFFSLLLDLLGEVLDRITEKFAGQALKVTFRPVKVEPYFIDIFVEPVQGDLGWNERKPTEEEKMKWESDRFNANPFADMISDTVYCYRLSCQPMINGAVCRNFVEFKEEDKVDILYCFEEMGDTATDKFLLNEYILTLKKAFFVE